MKSFSLLVAVAAVIYTSVALADFRVWTSTAGSKLEAEFVSLLKSKVTLRRENGKEVMLPLGSLKTADQDLIRNLDMTEKPTFLVVGNIHSDLFAHQDALKRYEPMRNWEFSLQPNAVSPPKGSADTVALDRLMGKFSKWSYRKYMILSCSALSLSDKASKRRSFLNELSEVVVLSQKHGYVPILVSRESRMSSLDSELVKYDDKNLKLLNVFVRDARKIEGLRVIHLPDLVKKLGGEFASWSDGRAELWDESVIESIVLYSLSTEKALDLSKHIDFIEKTLIGDKPEAGEGNHERFPWSEISSEDRKKLARMIFEFVCQ